MLQRSTDNLTTRILVPTGALGISFESDAFARGVNSHPNIICVDGGSTDSGPYYLGTATSKYSRAVTKAEWRQLMLARQRANVPLVIGTCGTCGTDASVDWMLDITREICEELGQKVRVAALYSSQSVEHVQQALGSGRVTPLEGAPEISAETLAQCTNIVALAG
ncbi:MAG: hypothetical protein K0U93_04800, partial [Gammaproteobacteria bacterium]|nr:hypothetical protein [Gammaproteobacteria bacterium]